MLKKDYKLPQFNKSKILGISLAILFSLGLVFFLSFGGRVGSIFTSDFGNLRERIEEIWLAGKAYMLWGAKAAGGAEAPEIDNILPNVVSLKGGEEIAIGGENFSDYGKYGFIDISSGTNHSCGIDLDGNAYCWGHNSSSQLGDGSPGGDSFIPVLVSQGAIPGGVSFISIGAAYTHTCGVGSNGNGYCWGSNQYGRLGNMETTNRLTPSYVIMKKNPKIEIGSTLVPTTTYNSTTSMNATTPALPTHGLLPVKLTNPDGQYATYNITVIAPPSAPLNLVVTKGNAKATLVWSVPTDNGGGSNNGLYYPI